MRIMICVLLCVSFSAAAQNRPNQVSGSFGVDASVKAGCVIVNSNNVPFGLYNPVTLEGAPEVTAESSVSIRCTNGLTNVSVSLNQGENATVSSTCAAPRRQLSSEDNARIRYQIYHDAQRSEVWGCDASNNHMISRFTSSVDPVQLKTYSRIFGGQNIAQGTYMDLVGVSVVF